jgi:ABC-type lipoprotein release transport system permease subunit
MTQLMKLAWRSIWRQKRRTIITASSIAFGLFFIILMTSLEEGIMHQAIDKGVRLQAGHITIEHEDYRLAPAVDLVVPNAERLADQFGQLAQVDSTKLLISGEGVARSGAGAFGIGIIGVIPEVETKNSPIVEDIREGTYLENADEARVVIGSVLAERLKLKPGKKLVIATNNANGDLVERLYRVKGIFQTGNDVVDGALVHMEIGSARSLFDLPQGSATQVGVILKDVGRLSDLLPIVEQALSGNDLLSAHPWQTIMPGLNGYITVERAGYLVMEGILAALVMFTILNTLLMSVTERKKEFATILALGGKGRDLRAQIFFEAALLGLIGVTLGTVLGGYFAYHFSVVGIDLAALSPGEDISIAGVPIDMMVHTLYSPRLLSTMALAVLGGTLLLSLIPISRVTRLSLSNLLR